MPHHKLSDGYVKNVEPPAERQIDIFDPTFPGFGLRVAKGGVKAWIVFYRIDGALRRDTIGRYPALSLAEARKKAAATLELVDQGKDPRLEAERERREEARQRADTVRIVADRFLRDIGAPMDEASVPKALGKRRRAGRMLRSAAEVKRTLDTIVLPAIGDRPIRDVTRRELIDLFDAVVEERGGIAANRALAWTRRLFRWAIEKDIIDASPVAGLKPPTTEEARTRILTDAELVDLWTATDGLGYAFGPWLKLLILTGQRRSEIASLRWDEINDKLIELAAARYKTGLPNVVPLSPQAVDLLAVLPRFKDCPFVFTSNGRTAISGFDSAKRQIDALVLGARQTAAKEAGGDPKKAKPIEDWRLHDLRRTVRTNLPKLGISPDVAERVMGHVVGGIRGVYDRYDYLPQKRHALDTWGRYVAGLVEGPAGNVVPLRGRG